MKKKTKIIGTISAMAISMGLLSFGVYAATSEPSSTTKISKAL